MTDFYCYDDGKTPNLWKRWYDDQSDRVQARHDAVIRILKTLNPWRNPYFHPLGNKGIGQIILKTDVQWRVLGFHSADRTEFTVVYTCYHKGDVYTPRDAQMTAETRMNEILGDLTRRKPCVPPS